MKEHHSDGAVRKMIRKFNQDENSTSISFSEFKEKLFSKIHNQCTETELSAIFHKVRDFTDGIKIVDTQNNIQGETIDIDTIFEALESDVIKDLGKLDKEDLKVILGEMKSDGLTQGLTHQEFMDEFKDYASNIYTMFGALLSGGHQDTHEIECDNETEDGIIIINSDGTLGSSFFNQGNTSMSDEDLDQSQMYFNGLENVSNLENIQPEEATLGARNTAIDESPVSLEDVPNVEFE